jgi:hypothetical protein
VERNTNSVRALGRFLVVASAALLVALFTTGRAAAHDLKMMVDLTVDPVKVAAWFDDDTPAQAARVSVVRDTGEEIAAGVTDDQGRWSFPKPSPGRYRIAVESLGHRDVIRFGVGEVNGDEEEQLAAEGNMRLNQTLGLSIGLTMLLGGSAAFIVLRSRRKAA